MKRTFLLYFLIIAAPAVAGPKISGPLAEQITKRDVVDIGVLSAEFCNALPWRIETKRAVSGEIEGKLVNTISATVYAQPYEVKGRIKRGKYVVCLTSPILHELAAYRKTAGRWGSSGNFEYAVVSSLRWKGAFYNLPFRVDADISSDDLVTIVDVVRGFLADKQMQKGIDTQVDLQETSLLSERIEGATAKGPFAQPGQIGVLFKIDKSGSFALIVLEKKNGRWSVVQVQEVET